MDKFIQLLERVNGDNFIRLIISGSKDKEKAEKITYRPVAASKKHGEHCANPCGQQKVQFQETVYRNKQVFHQTMDAKGFRQAVIGWTGSMKQMELETTDFKSTILISKKGTVTVKTKQMKAERTQDLSHNRTKQYLIPEGEPVPFLIDLGVMNKEGKIVRAYYDKFRQINRFLEFVRDILPELPKDREVTIIDFGCGKSYLTFAMYYYLHVKAGLDVRMIGLDLKKEVIAHCGKLAKDYGYEKLQFLQGDIAEYEGVTKADMVVTLHACDTATDLALAKAVRWGAKVIMSVPCCQHELNGQMHCETLAPIMQFGILKERSAALFTDGLRGELLKQQGYQVSLLEFIDMEHTPKNILIRGVYTGRKTGAEEQKAYESLCSFLGVEPMLKKLLS